jgi:nucleoside-diphosphate-sugar epimerase
MSSALVGYTGFVGQNILKKRKFEFLFNSSNFDEIKNKHFNLVVFSAASAEKWLANSQPEKDKAHIDKLIENLSSITADRFILISTIDVYKFPMDVNEESETHYQDNHAYGLNRGRLEAFVMSNFENHSILRLPGLFGEGIKKNVIFDFIHSNQIEKIDSRGSFQFYNLDDIYRDMTHVMDHKIPLINMATEPVLVSEIYETCFGRPFVNELSNAPAAYNFKSKHAKLWNPKADAYLYDRDQTLKEIKKFISSKL